MNTPSDLDDDDGQRPVVFHLPTGRVTVTVRDLDAIRIAVRDYLQRKKKEHPEADSFIFQERDLIQEMSESEPFSIEGKTAHIGLWQLLLNEGRWQLIRRDNVPGKTTSRAIRPFAILERANGTWKVKSFDYMHVWYKR